MDRGEPIFNHVIHKKWTQKAQRRHRSNLRQVRPVIDNREPACLKYPLVKTKKEMIIEGKYA